MTTPPPGQALTAETVKLLVKGDLLRSTSPAVRTKRGLSMARTEVVQVERVTRTHIKFTNGAGYLLTNDLSVYSFIGRPDAGEDGSGWIETAKYPEPVGVELQRSHLGASKFWRPSSLASQSTVPTRDGMDAYTRPDSIAAIKDRAAPTRGDANVSATNAELIEQALSHPPLDMPAPTPPEPVASALAEGEGLEVVAHRWRYVTDDGVTNWLIGQHVPHAGLACESEPLVTAASANARIGELLAEVEKADRDYWELSRISPAEAAAARIAELEARLVNMTQASIVTYEAERDARLASEAKSDRLAKALEQISGYEWPVIIGHDIQVTVGQATGEAYENRFPIAKETPFAALKAVKSIAAEALREPKSGGGE